MPTRPSSPDPSGATSAGQQNPFASLGAGLGAGFDFFQDWLKAAGSALPNMPGAASGSGGMSSWTMPTLDPAELEKRIQDLKTVKFWLEQNTRMIEMSIQGLEVQRMTLSTLKGMNVSMDAVRESLKARADAAATPPPAAPASPTPGAGHSDDAQPSHTANGADPAATESSDLINPIRWWDTLTQQFTHLASQAAQTVNDSVGESMDMLKQAQAKATEVAAQNTSAMKKAAESAKAKSGPATKTATKTGAKPARKGGKAT